MLTELPALYRPFLDAALIVPFVILATRVAGLRSFSKMSAFDFAVTVATGSVLAGVVLNPERSFLPGFMAIAALFIMQMAIAQGRTRFRWLENAVDNSPIMLMDGSRIIEANLEKAKVTRADLMGKLREANVLDFAEVRAVVMETTGDVSVLHGPADGTPLQDDLIEGVRRDP